MTIYGILSIISYGLAVPSLYIAGSMTPGSQNETIFVYIALALLAAGAALAVVQNHLADRFEPVPPEEIRRLEQLIAERREELEQQKLLKQEQE